MRYQSKSPVIEAVQFINCGAPELKDSFNEFPDWLEKAFDLGIITTEYSEKYPGMYLEIKRSKFHSKLVFPSQWITFSSIPGYAYPQLSVFDKNIFFKIYEEVKDEKLED